MNRLNDPEFFRLLENPADEQNFNAAAGELTSRYGKRLEKFFRNQYDFPDNLAKDFTDNVFAVFVEKLLDNKTEYQLPDNLFGYLLGIARNLARSHQRKNEVRARYLNAGNAAEVASEDDPELLLITKERIALVERKMAALGNENCRCVLQLWAMGYNFGEIAGMLGYNNAGVARKTKFDCLQKLIALVKYS